MRLGFLLGSKMSRQSVLEVFQHRNELGLKTPLNNEDCLVRPAVIANIVSSKGQLTRAFTI